ncbi:MAG: 2-keto-3-deoxy-L-rhamnonate aldolase [Chloroflexota bacterium]|nr:MAG: 2-keto-3-deoxy-L-rhamnonate aldolase [Chloroflexota bacterium]
MAEVAMRRKLLEGKTVSVISGHHSPDMTEYLAQFGADGIWFEGEHGPVDWDDIGDLSRACDLWGVASIVRISAGEPWMITRALDRGASGIVVPHVCTAEAARQVGEAARFGPLGLRGMFSGRRSYGVKNYFQKANEEVLVTVLIEEIEAIRNLDEILKEERIDVFFVAPSDLAQTMGHTGHHEHPEVQETIDGAIRKIVSAGRIAGTLVNDASRERYLDLGVRFVFTSWLPWVAQGLTTLQSAIAARNR